MIVVAHSCGGTLGLSRCNVERGAAFKLGVKKVVLSLVALASLLGLVDFVVHLVAVIIIQGSFW